jgi:hypothetical protein
MSTTHTAYVSTAIARATEAGAPEAAISFALALATTAAHADSLDAFDTALPSLHAYRHDGLRLSATVVDALERLAIAAFDTETAEMEQQAWDDLDAEDAENEAKQDALPDGFYETQAAWRAVEESGYCD